METECVGGSDSSISWGRGGVKRGDVDIRADSLWSLAHVTLTTPPCLLSEYQSFSFFFSFFFTHLVLIHLFQLNRWRWTQSRLTKALWISAHNFYVSSVVSQMWPCIRIINSQLTSVLNRRRNKKELWLAFSFKMGAAFMRSCFKEEPDILFKWHPFAAVLDFCTRREKFELFCKFRCLASPGFDDAGSPRSKTH